MPLLRPTVIALYYLLIPLQSAQNEEVPREEESGVSLVVNEWGAMLAAHAAAVAQGENGVVNKRALLTAILSTYRNTSRS